MPRAAPYVVGDRVSLALPEGRRHCRLVRVRGTITDVDIAGMPPGVRVQLDRTLHVGRALIDHCYATHAEVRRLPGPKPRVSTPIEV